MAFGGMLGAFTANPKLGSPMFVFTDAGPKDDSFQNREALKTLADQYGSTINFFTTPRGCGGKKGMTKGNMKYTAPLKSLRNKRMTNCCGESEKSKHGGEEERFSFRVRFILGNPLRENGLLRLTLGHYKGKMILFTEN